MISDKAKAMLQQMRDEGIPQKEGFKDSYRDKDTRIKAELIEIMYLENVKGYGELLTVCENYGPEYVNVARKYRTYCRALCKSYRRDPLRCLFRHRDLIQDEPQKLVIINERIREAQERSRSKAPDDETLLTEYATMTAKEIGKKYGAAESTVRGWIKAARTRTKSRQNR